ncbi:TetR/AcrR family transcriptional regulator [Mucilaginibacter rubeus]|uniref:TetR/AcrR family transcriptional regulator n=1 Tax=Mucilaginibacter rubeus TaxID=2027860 RepID=A0AAE6JKV3_9SPHI|nr:MULTISPECIES: TetR/AcrR family transcriptional regulator [Mucilaginibacter]QEM07183.1 TetR/AcrR family transcriptional regulator [Mucilaginibacter rubeus]QEM19639.1 TetR/AcrR family transcriptional regulator [Mucilaginibacter gossypii]QTE43667.1 TetR/AcrR family transcriptional regulator [Mucilaginibacter rubeus]QTE50267.1 TetR/AcrR family transcriptional regulator [Mucilaginibacter rubeus]QTE55354.1 TetR/AcrR family transcriptional regulator [Mucilaginibacter rubeus]
MAGRNKIYNEEEALDKAIGVFWEKGYDNASSRDLQNAMGIGMGSFYLAYKGGKQELFIKSMNRFFATYPTHALSMLKTIENPIEVIRQYYYVMADPKGRFRQFGCYFSNAIIQVSEPDLKDTAIGYVVTIADAFSAALLRAKEAGIIQPQIPQEMWNLYLLNLWTGLNATKFVEKDVSKIKAIIDFSLKVFE